MELKLKLLMLMKSKNLNGQKLAKLSLVSDSEISRILQGKSRPGLDNALRLAQAVGVSLDYLADDRIDVEPAQADDALTSEDHKLLGICRRVGGDEAQRVLEIVRILGYDVAMARLIGAASKPVIERLDDEIGEPRTSLSTNGQHVLRGPATATATA
ncbi:helix-turn-helix domain-containing protein [Paludisphaera mucosa]|uniref:Helix-turn-helix transcriptional regulator n=1 Tax=Paludisphaera mucosa TaxID=3030827 RepID=A0ABT6FDE5_9BACT|nr:helix-turn-helix transcriptional regulator [Paludisphaera mucosa]MDG3005607.1 helix-turn-helix transcriptional regulator [Paludisphaera mucosa]